MKVSGNYLKEGERRQATVLFADLSGFTSMSEMMDPEELTYMVNECLKIMGSCIEEHEGTIDKFIGDCVMATFGVPHTIENAPHKAINEAIEIRNQINRFKQESKTHHPLDIHIGINTGMVIAGPVGSDSNKEYTVMGDTVNVASRLKDISTAGQIFIGPTTYRYTKDDFQFKSHAEVKVKGKEELIEVHEILSVREKIDLKRWQSNRMISSILVGRNKELDRLSLHLLKVINGEGSIVNIIGEAGLGKSRLLAELRLKEEMGRVSLIEGRGISSGQNLSFYPILFLLRSWLNVREEDSAQAISIKLEKSLHNIAQNGADEIYPFIATLMGLKLQGRHLERIKGIEGSALEKLILKSLDDLLINLSKIKPLVVVIEDLHWCDLTTIEFLESHFRLAFENPILFVNVFRPGYKETSERILRTTHERYATIGLNIKLKALVDEDCECLINNLLNIKGFPYEVKNQITKRTGGNPFFIEEIIRSFIDEGIIVIRNDHFEVTQKIKNVVIPGTINEVIMSRIDRLDEKSRSLLKIASVIGRSFYYKVLTHLSEVDQEVDQQLALMEEIQLIKKQEKDEELAYLFKHALAQEATYESILLKKRQELHLKIAHTIEKIFADKISDFYGILAWHYSKGEDFGKAEEFLVKAGEEALRTSASSEAINYFKNALKIYRTQNEKEVDKEKIVSMEKNIGIALFNKGRFAEALPYFDSVLEYSGFRPKNSKIGTFFTLISGLFHLLVALFIPALKWRKIPTLKDDEINNLLRYQVGCTGFVESDRMLFLSVRLIKRITRFNLSKTRNAIEDFCLSTIFLSYAGVSFALHRRLLNFLQPKINQQDTIEKMVYEFSNLVNYRMEGNYSAYSYDAILVENSFKIGYLQNTSYYLIFGFFIDLGRGAFKNAIQKIEKLEEMARLFDNETVQGWLFISKAKLYTKERKLDLALIQIEKFIQFCKRVEDKSQLFWGYASKAYIEYLGDEVENATHSLNHVLQAKASDVQYVFRTTFVLSDMVIRLSQLEKSIENKDHLKLKSSEKELKHASKEALNVSNKIADDRVEILKCIGTYHWLIGKHKQGLKWWRKGIAVGEQLNAQPELARLYFEAGKRMMNENIPNIKLKGLTAAQCLKKAEEIFGQVGLEQDIKELQAFMLLRVSSEM